MNKLLTSLMLLIVSIHFGQLDYNSPYSQYALGDFRPEGTVYNKSMGGLGVSSGNALYLNMINPAMLTRNKTLTFDLGVGGSLKKIENKNGSVQKLGMNFDGLFLGFPVTKRLYTAVGITPFSSRKYNITSQENVDDSTVVNNEYSGSGGVTKVTWSTGYKIFNARRSKTSISAGLEINYLFGPIEDETKVDVGGSSLSPSYYNRQSFSGFTFVPGLLVRKEVKEGKVLKMEKRYDTALEDTIKYYTRSNRLFHKNVVDQVAKEMVVGQFLVVFNEREDVVVSSVFEDKRRAIYFKNAINTAKPDDIGVYIKSTANQTDRKGILSELDSLVLRCEKMQFTDVDSLQNLRKYAQRFIRRGSGVFLNFGAVYGLQSSVGVRSFKSINQRDANGGLIYADTVLNNSISDITVPSYFKIGFSLDKPIPSGYRKDGYLKTSIWSLGVDYSQYNWAEFQNTADNNTYNTAYGINIGGEICPDITQIRKKGRFSKVFYRIGASYKVEPYQVQEKAVRSISGSLGIGLPMYGAKQLPRYINLMFGYGQRGIGDSTIVQESFYNFALSITFNNKFSKRKAGL